VADLPDWSELSADQRAQLLSGHREIGVGAEVLNADLTVAEDVSSAVDNTSGDVNWQGSARIHRDLAITLALSDELAWGNTLLRVYRTVTSLTSGLSARVNRGVFCLTAAPRPLGSVIYDPASRLWNKYAFATTGQDRLYLLDREVGYSYVQPNTVGGVAVTVGQAIANVYAACGITGFLVDSSRASQALPQPLTYPLLPSSNDTSSSSRLGAVTDPQLVAVSGSSSATTWLDILNDINGLVTYEPVWADENGYLRHTPYVDPAVAPLAGVLDADAPGNIVDADRTVTRDLWGAPNQWIGIWSNMPDDGSGNPQTPDEDNGGIYVVQNDSTGPASIAALGGVPAGLRPKSFQITAATADDVQAQIEAQKAADMRIVTSIALSTLPYPAAGHFDVFTYRDKALPPDLGGQVRVRASEWTEYFTNDLTTWTLETV
jgi:hypothetical protein